MADDANRDGPDPGDPGDTDDETDVVTVFLRNDAEVLLLRRSDDVGSYAGLWGAVAGHAEDDPDATARAEIREETGYDPEADVTLVRRGDPFDVVDDDLGTRWTVHPYLFDCRRREIEPNDETADCEWAPPTEIRRRETVPDLWTSYDRVRPTPGTVRTDSEHGSAFLSIRALEVLRDEAALAADRGGTWTALEAVARALVDARPAMTVVRTRVDRAVTRARGRADGGGSPAALEAAAVEAIERARDADAVAAAVAADRLPDAVVTLSWSGTALDAIERADPEFVLVAESRPGREGVATAERLASTTGAAVALTTDAAFGDRLAETAVEALVVGADGVLPDGRVVNKVGTRSAATVGAREGVDCVVVAASDKIEPADAGRFGDGDGGTVDREERDPGEVYDGDAAVSVANPTFDVTPADLVDAVATDEGVLDAAAIHETAAERGRAAAWRR